MKKKLIKKGGKSKKDLLFSKGFDDINKLAMKRKKFIKSCFNCKSLVEDETTGEEVCGNPNVLPYDVVQDPNNNEVYCLLWGYINEPKE